MYYSKSISSQSVMLSLSKHFATNFKQVLQQAQDDNDLLYILGLFAHKDPETNPIAIGSG
jgi:hypothetical protein